MMTTTSVRVAAATVAGGAVRDQSGAGGAKRLLIIDDHEIYQLGMRTLLSSEPWVAACYGATSWEMAWRVAQRKQPQIALLSASVRGEPWFEISRRLHERLPLLQIVVTPRDGRVSAELARAHGAVGQLEPGLPIGAMLAAVKRIADGSCFVASATDRTPWRESALRPHDLSRREVEVLRCLVLGLSNQETAVALHLSPHTVKHHTTAIYRKLRVRNRTEAANRAQQFGLIG